ncbi:hypothetical protein BGZ51_009808, partial [Haplosporangium sp. Z 767]
PKRHREEDVAPPPKKTYLDTNPLKVAIEKAGLTDKAVVNDQSDLSLLDYKERVSVLRFLGSSVDRANSYDSLSRTALALQNSSFQEMEKLSTPPSSNTPFPVVNTGELYVRQAYKDLYDEVSFDFQDSSGVSFLNQVVVIGTADIGKSAFLVYFTIRLLATSNDDNPPIVIYHTRESSECFVYGGLSTLRSGNITDFRPFLSLPETWYLVDSSPEPWLERARTIISASPKTLYSDRYQDVDKRIQWHYYMASWTLKELERCWSSVERFKVVPKNLMEELYGRIGGVSRYVLEQPMRVLTRNPSNIAGARKSAFAHVQQAIDLVKDPLKMMQYFPQGKESLEYSSRLLHRWPTDDYKDFHLEWASKYIADKIGELLQDVTWQQILKKLVDDDIGTAKGPMFELYVRHIFRKGGCEFQIKDLQDETATTFKIPANPNVELFKEISAAPPGTLCIPKVYNYACIDLLLSPNCLFLITVSERPDIKERPFEVLLENLMDKGWIRSPEDAHLVFIVPSKIYDNFLEQKYLSTTGTLKQFALKIDLKLTAARGLRHSV